MGCQGRLVSEVDDLRDALRMSLADDRPTLVHVPVADRSHKLY
jgi:thiamine pyrophosphate-dependent acetolactate synthase large subunit-like protein